MKWAEISIKTTHEATEFIAEIFHDLGAAGVVIEDPELVNTYRNEGRLDYTDIPEAIDTEVVTVKAYLPVNDELDEKMRCFERKVDALAGHDVDKGLGDISCSEVHDEDWADNWKKYFHPGKVGDIIVIKPIWEEYTAGPDDIVVELDPEATFGTGTHPTTAMCVRELEDLVKGGMEIFDVGTGSGILSIVAAKLGAGKVTAVDYDRIAVEVSTKNIVKNHVENIITTGQSDLLQQVNGKADIIIANIIADIVIRLLDEVKSHLKPGGILLASGIISERIADVTEAVMAHGFTLDKVIEEGGWAAMVIRCDGGEQ